MALHSKSSSAWKPGQSGNPAGRQIGSRNKLSTQYLDDVLYDFMADKNTPLRMHNGAVAIRKWRDEYPHLYMKAIHQLLPREFKVQHESLVDGMSDDELTAALDHVRLAIAARTGGGADLRATAPAGKDKLN